VYFLRYFFYIRQGIFLQPQFFFLNRPFSSLYFSICLSSLFFNIIRRFPISPHYTTLYPSPVVTFSLWLARSPCDNPIHVTTHLPRKNEGKVHSIWVLFRFEIAMGGYGEFLFFKRENVARKSSFFQIPSKFPNGFYTQTL
jgi:hypothetical protein